MDDAIDALPRNDMDLEAELESLREFLVKGGTTFLGMRHFLPTEEVETRIDQIIALLPKEIRRARRILREEQRIIQDAKDEARRLLDEARAESNHLVTEAQEEADRLVESSAIRQRALEAAETTIQQAEEAAREIREKSYDYAAQVMNNVSTSLQRLVQSVEKDREQLHQMRPDGE